VKLNDFFAKEGIKMSDFMRRRSSVIRVAEAHTELLGLACDG